MDGPAEVDRVVGEEEEEGIASTMREEQDDDIDSEENRYNHIVYYVLPFHAFLTIAPMQASLSSHIFFSSPNKRLLGTLFY